MKVTAILKSSDGKRVPVKWYEGDREASVFISVGQIIESNDSKYNDVVEINIEL